MLGLLAVLCDRHIAAESNGRVTGFTPPEKVVFVWACRNSVEFELLDEELLAEAR